MKINYYSKFLEEHWKKIRDPSFWQDRIAQMSKVGNRSTAMKKTLPLDRAESSPDPIWRNIKPIPDVESFRVTARVKDQLLLKFGLKRNIGGHIEYIKYRNRDLNRYMEHQLIRLSKAQAAGNWKLYWAICMGLLLRSKVYYVLALNHVFPTWYKTISWRRMTSLYRQVRKLRDADEMVYSRAYITKANGKWRPLGVPSPSWRIWLAMLNMLLVYAYDSKLSENQHGFRPGRGTLSAWKVVLERVIGARNIYEYDLRAFFDRVRVDWPLGTLYEWGVPFDIVIMLGQISSSAIRLPKDLKMDESSQLRRQQIPVSMRSSLGEFSGPEDLKEFADSSTRGFPQGAATSPFLANVALEDTLMRVNPDDSDGPHTLQYADDGLWYSDGPIRLDPTSEMSKAGIELNWEKSGWVKKDGVWLKPLKFLGLVYDGRRNKFYSETRSGKSLVFDRDGLLQALIDEDLGKGGVSSGGSAPIQRRSWELLAKSRFIGFIQSRLYNGSWNQDTLWKEFLLQATRGSWVGRLRSSAIRLVGLVDLFNASSIASRALLSLLRHCDGSARKAWSRASLLHVPKPDVYKPPKRESYGGKFVNPIPIKVKMASEWRRAYAMSDMLDFEIWLSRYVDSIVQRRDNLYSEEHLTWWYKKNWLHERGRILASEIKLLRSDIQHLRSRLHLGKF